MTSSTKRILFSLALRELKSAEAGIRADLPDASVRYNLIKPAYDDILADIKADQDEYRAAMGAKEASRG